LASRALQLQPDLPEAHLARGFSLYYGEGDYDAALNEFEIARGGLPNEMEVYLALGAIKRRQGRWAESTADLEKAATLNPQDSWPLQNLFFNFEMLRQFDKANETLSRALALAPNSFGLWQVKSNLAFLENGDLSAAEEALRHLDKLPDSSEKRQYAPLARANLFLLQRKYADALAAAQSAPEEPPQGFADHAHGKQMLIGLAHTWLGNESAAGAAFSAVKEAAQNSLRSIPGNADLHGKLGLALAFLGEKEAAMAEANRAMELRPETKDAFEGPVITELAAEIYCVAGDHGRAIELLDGLLSRPASITVAALKTSPIWDPLRNEAAFQQLLTKYGAKT
jgi:tetratricopeptide (TPR) repeat protein